MALFTKLIPKKHHQNSSTCLLLDVSGSMSDRVEREGTEDGMDPRKIDLLFQAIRETPECAGLKAYAFGSSCHPLETIPESDTYEPHGGTNMAGAFDTAKAAGFFNAIIITDGAPDSEQAALNSAAGMRLGIIYVGPSPMPSFLERLAAATDGTFQIADLRDTKMLEDAIIRALPAPEAKPEGAIKL